MFDVFSNSKYNDVSPELSQSIGSIEILDMFGKTVLQQSKVLSDISVDVRQLPSGVYLLRLFGVNELPVTKKFIKLDR